MLTLFQINFRSLLFYDITLRFMLELYKHKSKRLCQILVWGWLFWFSLFCLFSTHLCPSILSLSRYFILFIALRGEKNVLMYFIVNVQAH